MRKVKSALKENLKNKVAVIVLINSGEFVLDKMIFSALLHSLARVNSGDKFILIIFA